MVTRLRYSCCEIVSIVMTSPIVSPWQSLASSPLAVTESSRGGWEVVVRGGSCWLRLRSSILYLRDQERRLGANMAGTAQY